MKRQFLGVCLTGVLFLCSSVIYAAQTRDIIRLTDGTAIEGRLMGFDGRAFTVSQDGTQRQFARERVHSIELNRSHAATQNEHISLAKAAFSPNEEIAVRWHRVPGNTRTWITVVPANSPDHTWGGANEPGTGSWWFTDGAQAGEHNIGRLPAGIYEVRVYFDITQEGYVVRSRLPFTVGDGVAAVAPPAPGTPTVAVPKPQENGHITLAKTTFSANERIQVRWHGLPGNTHDWISVVTAGSGDNTWGNWWYSRGERTGERDIGQLPPGEYEVRVYYDWPRGSYEVKSRTRFTVR